MVPEGLGRPRAAPKDGPAAPLINLRPVGEREGSGRRALEGARLRLDAARLDQGAARLCTRPRGRDRLRGDERAQQALAVSRRGQKAIGKRVVSAIIQSGSIGKQLKKLRKRSASVEPLLQAQATLNLTPPPRKPAAAAETASSPSPPPQPPPPIPPPPLVRPLPVTKQGKVLRLKGSVLAEGAVQAARGCEFAQVWLRNGIGEPLGVKPGWEAYDAETRRSHQSHRITTYLAALAAIKERFWMKVCCEEFATGGCAHSIPCECGGRQAPWPWIIHHPFHHPFCDCHLALRRDWVRYGLDGPTSSEELVAEIERAEAGRWRPACQKEGYRVGCTCNVCYECSEGSESD